MVDLLDEVKEDIKHEQTLNLVKKYFPFALGLMAALIIGVSINLWWNSYKLNKAHKYGGEYIKAIIELRNNKLDNAQVSFSRLADDKSTNYSALAAINAASIASMSKDYQKAIQLYDMVVNNSSFGQVFRDYCEFQAVSLKYVSGQVDYKTTISELQTLRKNNNIFKYSILELIGNLALENNDNQQAMEAFGLITLDPDATSTIKSRVQSLINYNNIAINQN